MNTLLIAGTHSGCGKTTVTLALLAHLRAQGLCAAPFKAGPDFLDPMQYSAMCHRPAYQLDTCMMGEAVCLDTFARYSTHADGAVIEGMMGLFDGAKGIGGEGSSVHLAALLGAPVLLVVDAVGMAGSIAPMVAGFADEARRCGASIAGVVANRVGSEAHAALLASALQSRDLPPLIAWLSADAPTLTERHLGLIPPTSPPDFVGIWRETSPLPWDKAQTGETKSAVGSLLRGFRIAIARDDACCFLYAANLDWLRDEGAEAIFFSPLAGDDVPEADALWLPGGYPELHAARLSRSRTLAAIRAFCAAGKPVLAECGGMMMLGETLTDLNAVTYAMAGVLPCRFSIGRQLAELGYRRTQDGLRGHVFHYAKIEEPLAMPEAFAMESGNPGICVKRIRASWTHWYFPSAPQAAAELFR